MAKINLGVDEMLTIESEGGIITISSRSGVTNIKIAGRWLSLSEGEVVEHTHFMIVDKDGKNVPIINKEPIERL